MGSDANMDCSCCYYTSWENVPLTASLFLAENIIFFIIWEFEISVFSLCIDILILLIAFQCIANSLGFNTLKFCSSCSDEKQCYKNYFILFYNKINQGFDTARKYSSGLKSLLAVEFLLKIYYLNLSLFTTIWILTLWSFIKPALKKFLGLDIFEFIEEFIQSSSIKETIIDIYNSIPRYSKVKKTE